MIASKTSGTLGLDRYRGLNPFHDPARRQYNFVVRKAAQPSLGHINHRNYLSIFNDGQSGSDADVVVIIKSIEQSILKAQLKIVTRPGQLAIIAEAAGEKLPSSEVSEALFPLLKHQRPIVREGALLGLSHHLNNESVRAEVARVAKEDSSQIIKEIASEMLGI